MGTIAAPLGAAAARTPSRATPVDTREKLMAVIAYVLLFLYAGNVTYMIYRVVICGMTTGCSTVGIGDGVRYVVTTVGALVSALVVARLAVASRTATDFSIAGFATGTSSKSASTLAWGYIGVWLAVGLGALIVGVLIYPSINQTVSDLGTAWLGIAVAAGYAYFGIDPAR